LFAANHGFFLFPLSLALLSPNILLALTMFNYCRPTPRNGSSFVVPLGSAPAVVAQTRGHGHGARGHMYQPSMQSGSFTPTTRRVRLRALTITSFIAAAASAEIGGAHRFSAPGAVNRSVIPDVEGISRPDDRSYAWGREGFAPLPWIPAEGDSQWWGSFNPIQNQTWKLYWW
jgi:hypothetical protein